MRLENRNHWKLIGLSLLCLTGLITACGKASPESTGESQTIETEEQDEIDAWGEVKYQDAYQIIIDFPATVESIQVKEGDVVHKGDVLAVLNIEEYNKTIAKLEDQKAAGEAALKGIYQNTSGLEAQIEQKKRDVATAQTDWSNANVLYEAGDISKTEYDKYVTNLEAQKTNQRVLEVQLEQLKNTNSSNSSQQASSNGAIEKELDIYKGKLQKDYLDGNRLVSNVENGIIKSIAVENGTVLGSDLGQKLVMEIIDQDSVYVSAEVDEEFIHNITLDTPVRIVPAMNPQTEFQGKVSQIAAMAVEKDGGRIVKVQVMPDDPERVLKPGYTVDAYFDRKEVKEPESETDVSESQELPKES